MANIVRIQTHDAPDWFGDGWLVSFEVPKRASEEMSIIRAAFFRNDNGKPVLAKDILGEGFHRELCHPLLEPLRVGA